MSADPKKIPPDLLDVAGYLTELGSAVDPQDFMDHYDTVGWIIGGTRVRMKDWKAACRLWDRREKRQVFRFKGHPQASLFALQAQLRTIEVELDGIVYPGGCSFKIPPTGDKQVRYEKLIGQRQGIKNQIDRFAVAQ